jgi:murein DD-endopeptidase MepM/ murein hydrolase activator NlpD
MATPSPTLALLFAPFRKLAALAGLVALGAVSVGGVDLAEAQQAAGEDAGIVEPLTASSAAAPGAVYKVLGPGAQPQGPLKGADVTGDGVPDFANPTGQGPRGKDAYGEGAFGASRGGRGHAGVDYVAQAGQSVFAPIAGYVTRVGHPYAGDSHFRYVEITNPGTGYKARVMYVGPQVGEGQSVTLGQEIGRAQTLQRRYPRGITDHVHLEIARVNGAAINAAVLVPVRG